MKPFSEHGVTFTVSRGIQRPVLGQGHRAGLWNLGAVGPRDPAEM